MRATNVIARRLAVLLILGLAAPAVAQTPPRDFTDETTLPAGRRGERIRLLVDVLNGGDRARLEAFVRAAFAPSFLEEVSLERHVAALTGFYEGSRGLELHGVRRYVDGGQPNREVVIVRNRLTEAWQGIVIAFEDGPEQRIAGLDFQPARPPKSVPAPGPLTEAQAVAEIGTFVDRLASAEVFSGSVLVTRGGLPIYAEARGLADRNHKVPNRLDTKFNLGSMNKMVTAVAIAQLVEAGKLSFKDSVGKYLGGKGWTKADLGKVRIEHLLSHSSGLGSYFNETYERTARQLFRKVDDYKPLVAEETLAFEPGSRSAYSNTGFLLLGAVIEAVTGNDYFDHVRERVYRPAGMKNSDCYDIDLVVPHLAIGYSPERTATGRTWRANTFEHVVRGGPAGGGYSTVEDLLLFAEALRSGRLVSAAMTETLWSPKPELSANPQYGFGFGISRDALGRSVGHSGGFAGISSVLTFYPEAHVVVVVLSNVDGGSEPVARKIRETLGRIR
jgi:CubicO group peptidase (beta-lactamase class C family)